MSCRKCTKNVKCNCFSLTIKICIWCFDNWLECLKKYDTEIFFFHMEKIALWKIKLIELECILFRDLNVNDKKGNFYLKDSRIIFKQIDSIMWDICMYSSSFKNIWRVMRFHPQWLRFVGCPRFQNTYTKSQLQPKNFKIVNVINK